MNETCRLRRANDMEFAATKVKLIRAQGGMPWHQEPMKRRDKLRKASGSCNEH